MFSEVFLQQICEKSQKGVYLHKKISKRCKVSSLKI